MYQVAIEQFLTANKVPYTINGDQITCRCLNPKHMDSNPSFQFNAQEGYGHCFGCNYSTHISHLTEVEMDEETLRQYEYQKLIEQLHVGTTEVGERDVILPPKAFPITWMVRQISGDLMRDLGVYYCEKGKYCGRLIFPITDVDGVLLGYSSWIATPESLGEFSDRLVEPTRPHAKYLHSYGMVTADVLYPTMVMDLELKHHEGLHLTEGLFDALSLIQLGHPAVCNFGLGSPSMNKVGEFLSMGYTKLVPAFDNDQAGMKGWQSIKDQWSEYVEISQPTQILRDLRDFGAKDANEYLTRRLTNA